MVVIERTEYRGTHITVMSGNKQIGIIRQMNGQWVFILGCGYSEDDRYILTQDVVQAVADELAKLNKGNI